MQFICYEGSVESEHASLKEVNIVSVQLLRTNPLFSFELIIGFDIVKMADSYVMDERVGFAEPASGVGPYVCPPNSKTREMLGEIFPKDQFDALNSIDYGLIGVIVWRKSTISPKHKHNSKNQNSVYMGNLEKNPNQNANIMFKHGEDEGGGDVPPRFGPPSGPAREEDDLPEFNFSSKPQLIKKSGIQPIDTHSRSIPRPVDQMRELIHKYGQPKTKNSRSLTMMCRNGTVNLC